jgi:hypothetical protein
VVIVDASELFADQLIANTDASGNFIGGTDTFTDVTNGFSFDIDQGQLTSASVSGLGIPAETCTVDANGNESNCSATTIDVSVNWTGQGPILRAVCDDHVRVPGFSQTNHLNEVSRAVTATGTFSGSTLNAGDIRIGELASANQEVTTVCIGNSCPPPPPGPPPCE